MNVYTKRNQVNLHWSIICKKKSAPLKRQNFGDVLGIPIYEYMTTYYQLDKEKKLEKPKHLYTIGSIIFFGYQDAVIWGSGILREESKLSLKSKRKLDIRCVRGPLTKERLQKDGYDVSECVLGDPGVLLPLLYQPIEYREKREYSVIFHFSSKERHKNQIEVLTSDWKRTVNDIYNSNLIISSSLHGIIIAEAYGIPAIWLNAAPTESDFKYMDYYYSTERKEIPVCASIEDALCRPIPKLPDLTELQNNLIRSFPIDLWK